MTKEELKQTIINANSAYRVGTPVMPDIDYDNLLEKFCADYPDEAFSFKETLNEGFLNTGNKKVQHKFIAGSLNKLKYEEPDNVIKFINGHIKTKLNVSAKIDGLSGIATYSGGKLIGFATRGDGKVGVDIFDKSKYIKCLPKTINDTTDLVIRGELVITKSDFEKMEGDAARNIVSGIINRKEWKKEDVSNISFIAYTILGPRFTKREQFDRLNELGFTTAWHAEYDPDFFLSETIVDDLFVLATQSFDYICDGLVLSDSSYRNEDVKYPENQVAFKTNTQTVETRLIDIEWQGPSKNGRFNPIGILEPVECGEVVVSRCTLHNIDFIKKHNLKNGSRISILRSGDVIPKMVKVIESDENCTDIEYPTHCTCCGSALISDGPYLICKNNDCEDQTTYRVMHFIKKLGVEFASFKTLKAFGINNFKDLVKFIPNAKYKSEVKFVNELKEKVFTRSETDIFCAMNFDGLSEILLNKIIEFYGANIINSYIKVENGIRVLDNAIYNLPNEMGLPEGIGDITFNKFANGLVEAVTNTILITTDPRYHPITSVQSSKPKTNISVCFTGPLQRMGRTEASKIAEQNGWTVKSSVTKGLTYLVTNESTMTTKMKKALQLGTTIIDEEQFFKFVLSDLDSF